MNIQFTFKQMQSSQALADLTGAKLKAKIDRFTARPLHAHVTFSIDGISQKIHVSLITSDGYDIEAEHCGGDMYAEVDVVAEKIEAQLRKHKERLTSRKSIPMHEKISKMARLDGADSEEGFTEDSLADDAIDALDVLQSPPVFANANTFARDERS